MFDRCVCFGLLFTSDDDLGRTLILLKYAHASTVANCHLYNHPFRNLYEIRESGNEEEALFAAVTRKHHQIEADRVIGGIGSAATVTMLRDALSGCPLLCMCVWCALPQSWAPVTNAGSPRKCTYNNIH